jgi:ribosomal protein S18 acetylase RimI-like enzyme
MNLIFRNGSINDLEKLKKLSLKSWGQFQSQLTPENWERLYESLSNENTYIELLKNSTCFVCTSSNDEIIGMVFLVPKGNPTEIYEETWCYIRFLTVDPHYGGNGIGRKLTQLCIDMALQNNETEMALHTSEMMDAARFIYESIGFKIFREIDSRLGKRYWLYKLDLLSLKRPSLS